MGYNYIGTSIRAARIMQKLSQDALAAKIGISRQALVAIERGQSIPTDPTYKKLQSALGVDFSDPKVIVAAQNLLGGAQ